MDIAGKVAVVTGAASGIGRGIAGRLVADGAAVVVVDLDRESAEAAVAELTELGGRATAKIADVSEAEGAEAIISAAETTFGGLDILVNNAGGYEVPVFPDAPVEHWRRTIDVNLLAAMLGIQHALPALERRGGGAVVNVASSAGLGFGPYEGAPEYAAAKAGLMRLTACLGSLAARGIRVNCVCPHTVATPGVLQTVAELRAEGRELPQALRDPFLETEEVVDAVVDLIRDETHAGRVVTLRGGETPRLLA